MRRNTRASLNLSVNAIVVFVLAFAMLGVGLTFTSLIRENVMESTEGIIPNEEFENPPSSSEPLTISDELTMERGDKENLGLGFYNKDAGTARNVKLGISKCLNEDGETMDGKVPDVVSPVNDVPPSDWRAFKIIVEADAEDFPPGDYVCTFSAFNGGNEGGVNTPDSELEDSDTEGYVFYEKQFFLTITS